MKIIATLLFGLLLGLIDTKGQSTKSQPLDKSIRSGVLENGLTYFIKPLEKPDTKLNMRFLVKNGSSHEENHELNFAHHIEHLAFRETASFPQGLKGNSGLLAKFGMAHRDMGATSGLYFTSYSFRPPTGNEEALENGLLWFKDIANGLDLSKRNIDRERGVLLQESIMGKPNANDINAARIMRHKLFPCHGDHTDFVEHNQQFPHLDLQQFYEKWYRPDLVAISIAGNIADVDKLEKMIVRTFSKLKIPDTEVPEMNCVSSYFDRQPGFYIVDHTDPLGNPEDKISYYLIFKDSAEAEELKARKKLQRNISGRLVGKIFNKRLKESLKQYGNTFSFYSKYEHVIYPNSLKLIVRSKLKEEKEALRKALFILNQLKSHGITSDELQILKEEELKRLHSHDTSSSNYWVQQIDNYFVHDEWLPENKNSELIHWITNLSAEDLNLRLAQLISTMPNDIGVIVSENYRTDLLSEKVTRSFIHRNLERKTPIFKPQQDKPILMSVEDISALPQELDLVLEEDVIGTQLVQLKNGLTIILKPMKAISGDMTKIHLHGFTPKGASSLPEEDYYSAMFAPYIVNHSGIGQLNKFELDEFYKTNDLKPNLLPYLHLHEAGIRAEVVKEDLETLLQLIYLYFSRPRQDKIAFKDWKALQKNLPSANSSSYLLDTLKEVTGDFTTLPSASKRLSAIKKIEFKKSHKIYNQIFGNAEDFTFILAGDFTNNDILPLLNKYLGNLPNNGSSFPALDSGYDELPSAPRYLEVPKFNSYKSINSAYGFKFTRTEVENDAWKEEIKVKALGFVLNRILFKLRSEDGFSLYFFGASGMYNRYLNRYEIRVLVNCVPEELNLIRKEILLFLDDLKTANISKSDFLLGLKDLEYLYNYERLEQPDAMVEKLYHYHRYKEAPISSNAILDFINSLTVDDIAETANKYFQEELFYEVVINGEQQ